MFRKFIYEKDASDWLEKNYGIFLSKIQNEMNINNSLGDALYCYTGSMSKSYNIILKFNNGLLNNIDDIIDKYYNTSSEDLENYLNNVFAEEAKNDIRKIYNAFSYNIIEDDIILFHYFDSNYFKIPNKKNKFFSINYFISTTMISKSKGIKKLIESERYNSVLKINVRKGTNCIPIGNNPASQLKEYEIILKPCTKFKIIKIKKHFFNKIRNVIECQIEI